MPVRSIAKTITPLNILAVMVSLCASNLSAIEYIVKLNSHVDEYDLENFNMSSTSPLKVSGVEADLDLIKVSANGLASADDVTALIKDEFDAKYVVENVKVHAFVNPNDPRHSEQWALDMINAKDAWDIAWGSHEVVVAVVDTGIDLSHPDLQANKWVNADEIPNNNKDDDNNGYIDDINGWDWKGNDKNPNDETGSQNPGHGTHCAGIIGASCDNNIGVCGISPKVSLMALRFLGADGSGDLFSSVKAIQYAAANGAHIISASWGAAIPQSGAQPIIDAIKAAEEQGVIFIAAAGNDGKSNDSKAIYPANAQTPNMISVAASDRTDQKPNWSNYGRKVDIASPGESILSTIPGDYKELSGTSMATPLVAGLVALLKSIDKDLTGAVARSILQSTGKEVNIDTESKRRIDAREAVKAVKDKKLTVVPATLTLELQGTQNVSAWGGFAPYSFKSLQPNIATIDATGKLVAVAEGDVTVEVTDAAGNTAKSVSFKVGRSAPKESSCPLPNELFCLILCGISPELPWCEGGGGDDGGGIPDLPEFPGMPGFPGLDPEM